MSENKAKTSKTGLKFFVVVIPKEGMAGSSPAKFSFGVTPCIELYSVVFTVLILWLVIPKESLDRLVPANLFSGMTTR